MTCISKKERKSIHGANGVQSYQDNVQQLTDVIVRHVARFLRIALRLLDNTADAEDPVQGAFLSAFTNLDKFRGQAKMSTWLTTMVINVARMKLPRRTPQAQISLDETHGEQNLLLAEMLLDHQPNANLPKDSPTRQPSSRLPCVKLVNFGI